MKGIKSTNPVSVGDKVVYKTNDDGTGLITDILERKNYIIRKATKLSSRSHIIAANIDTAFLMITLALPRTPLLFIDRFLLIAEAYHIPAKLIINKMDIYDSALLEEMNDLMNIYENIGYECIKISALNNHNVDSLKDKMKGKINLIAGNSGVGKSTLINTIDPRLNLKVGEISASHQKGIHTTTFAEMHELVNGGFIIDTPGLKSFGVIDMEKEDLSHYFPEMRDLLHDCKYHNCRHINEPDCAVLEALNNGKIAESRYLNYLDIYDSDENIKYR